MNTMYFKFFVLVMATTLVITSTSCKKDDKEEPVSVLEEGKERYDELRSNPDLVEVVFPSMQEPGPPFYARVGKFSDSELIFYANDRVFIPFVRQIGCIDESFNLLEFFHVPNSFFCPLTVGGSGLIEPDAQPGTFPAIAFAEGDNVDMWIVEKSKFDAAIADGILTISELESLQPLKGNGKYTEYNVPRPELGHLLIIEASGNIASTNQNFKFSFVERNYQQVSISLELK